MASSTDDGIQPAETEGGPGDEFASTATAGPPVSPVGMGRWLSMATLQGRVLQALSGEISITSAYVEDQVGGLSKRFRELAEEALDQTNRVKNLSRIANVIEIHDKVVPLTEIASNLGAALDDVSDKIVLTSQQAMSMVYALDDVAKRLAAVERCVGKIDKINKQTNMLALNATIEAVRAGAAGAAFKVVANEVKELSVATRELAVNIRVEVGAVADGIRLGQSTLKKVATFDMSDNIAAQNRLRELIDAIERRDSRVGEITQDAANAAGTIAQGISSMVTGLQFQDRAKQRLEHVIDTLFVVENAWDELKQEASDAKPEADIDLHANDVWLKHLLERCTLGEVRARFVAQIIDGIPLASLADDAAAEAHAADDVELF